MYMKLISLLWLLLFSLTAIAQKDGKPGKREKLLFPFVVKSLETKWGFGGVAAVFFKPTEDDSLTRTSDANLLGLYTLRKQLILAINSTVFFPHENHILRFQSSYSYYPDDFWGLGNNTKQYSKEEFSQRQYFINPQLLVRVNKKFYLGVSYEFQHTGNDRVGR